MFLSFCASRSVLIYLHLPFIWLISIPACLEIFHSLCPHDLTPCHHISRLYKIHSPPCAVSVQSTKKYLTNMVTVGEGSWQGDVAEHSCLLSSYKLLSWSTSPDQKVACDLPPTLALVLLPCLAETPFRWSAAGFWHNIWWLLYITAIDSVW